MGRHAIGDPTKDTPAFLHRGELSLGSIVSDNPKSSLVCQARSVPLCRSLYFFHLAVGQEVRRRRRRLG